jgi:RNA polymerase sigma-70 factor, ECF subfamily
LGKTLPMNPRLPPKDNARQELAALFPAIAGGDHNALARLYQRTSAKLFGVVIRILGNETEAEEVLQDVYVSVWRNAARFEVKRASPITWLAVIARNRAIDRLRARRLATAPLEEAGDPASDDMSALELLEQAADRERLADCLGKLGGPPRRAVEAAFLDGATYSQLAEREKVPLGTMKSRIRRALLTLKECLEA